MATETPFDFNQAGYPGDSTAGFEGRRGNVPAA